MTPEVRQLFGAVCGLDAAARRAFLDVECDDDTTRHEVASLLDAFDDAPRFLDEPAFELGRDDLDETALAGERAGAYRLVEVLGEGGMGTVWRGVRDDERFTRQVAVKVLKRGLDTAELLARFHAEQRTLAGLQHPNVVTLLDAGSLADGRPYVVMEHVDGTPIDRYCDARHLGLEARLALFRQVCAAVAYAHRHLVVHRDLKPSNVLVTTGGTVKLLDFGIAKILDDGAAADVTRADRRAPLTLRYASPEQVRGAPVTTASDVYSLGVLLYELLAGRGPYPESQDLETAVIEETPAPPSKVVEAPDLRRRLRGDLDTIVLHALAKAPEERYATVDQLADDLERHRRGLPVKARPETFLYRAGKLLRRRRLEAAALALVVAALAWAAVASYLGQERARRSEGVAWRAHADAVYVTNYLGDVLERAARGELDGGAVLRILEDAEERIAGDLGQAPEAEARLRYAVARAYLGLGRLDDAERHARRALELSRSTVGLGSRDVERNVELLNQLRVRRGAITLQ